MKAPARMGDWSSVTTTKTYDLDTAYFMGEEDDNTKNHRRGIERGTPWSRPLLQAVAGTLGWRRWSRTPSLACGRWLAIANSAQLRAALQSPSNWSGKAVE